MDKFFRITGLVLSLVFIVMAIFEKDKFRRIELLVMAAICGQS